VFNKAKKKETVYDLLAGVDKTYSKLPTNLQLEIEKVSLGLTEFGPRKLGKFGPGTEFYEARDFRPEVDEPRKIHARLSARAGRPIVVEKEAEIRQHFYLWRDASGSMNYNSRNGDLFSKKQSSEIMLLALAKHLSKNEELIGVLDGEGVYRGSNSTEWLAPQLVDVTVMTGEMPLATRKLPKNSTVVLFSDFMFDTNDFVKGLEQLSGDNLRGFVVMVLDPQELEFEFRGHTKFKGLEGEASETFKRAEALQAEYIRKIHEHINKVERICSAKGFDFILQRTDKPLHEAIMSMYGLKPIEKRAGTKLRLGS
jgi:uncharacterized protein (DUF58 family)